MNPLLIGAAVGAGTKVLETVANGFMQQRAAAYNQEMYEKNQAANYLYQMNAQRNAAANELEGLRQAGLSPVFADGAQGMSVAAGTQGTAKAPETSFDPANLMLMAQTRLMKAQADKVEADAKSVELDNANKEGRNKTLAKNMAQYFTKLSEDTADKDLAKFFKAQADYAASGDFVAGNYDAYLNWLDVQGKSEDAIARKADKKLSAWLAELRWNKAKGQTADSSEFVKALSSLDSRQSDLLAEQAANLIAQRRNIDKNTELTGAKLILTNEQIDQVKAATAQLENSNIIEMFEKGDYGKALLAMLLMVFSGTAKNGLPMY